MSRIWRRALAGAAAALIVCSGGVGDGQPVIEGLTVMPVTVELSPGQRTTVLTLENHTGREVDFQVRPFAWDQPGGNEALTPTDALVVSPPLGRIAIDAGQVVRLVLRQPAQAQEAAYRILLDEVPPPPQPGAVGFALRLSLPVFAEPTTRTSPHVRWSIQAAGGAYYLVAVNDGGRHDVVHDMALTTAAGRPLALDTSVSPYILAGATRRWRILTQDPAPSREALRLTAHANAGAIDQTVSASSVAP